MALSGHDDPVFRPVGAASAKRRGPSTRHIFLILLVMVLGGGGGAAAYFLSDVDTRDLIGFLDIADPGGPKLSMFLPGMGGDATKPAPVPGGLLVPPGGAPPLPVPEAIKDKPPVVMAEKAPDTKAPDVKPATAKPADAKPDDAKAATTSKLVDSKLLAGLMLPPPPQPAIPPPPPMAAAPDQIPSFGALAVRNPSAPLTPAPDKALMGSSTQGPVPVIAADGRQSWKVYARPFDGAPGQARIAVIVINLGLDPVATDAAITKLQPEVSLAFSPYAVDLAKWIAKARAAGHEALVMLPVITGQPGARDPGPLALSADYSDKDNVARLEALLTRSPGVVGVVAPTDSFLSTSLKGTPVLSALLRRGIALVAGAGHGGRQPALAQITDQIDRSPWHSAIESRLNSAATAAKPQTVQVLLAQPLPVTFQLLSPWLDTLASRSIVPAPVTAVASPPGA